MENVLKVENELLRLKNMNEDLKTRLNSKQNESMLEYEPLRASTFL